MLFLLNLPVRTYKFGVFDGLKFDVHRQMDRIRIPHGVNSGIWDIHKIYFDR